MLLHLYGPDSYRRGRASREIITKYQTKYPDGVVGFFDCEEAEDFAKLQTFTSAQGLFAKASLAVVSHPEEATKDCIKLLKAVADAPLVTLLVIADKKLPKDFSFLYGDGVGPAKKEFEPLEGIEFLKFLKADALQRGLEIGDKELTAIGEAYASDTWGAVTEIQRVAQGGTFEGRATTFDFIGLIRSIASPGELPRRLKALMLLLEYDEPAKIFNMAAAFTRGVDKVRMADYDIAIKSGKLEYSEALLEYVLQ